MSNVSTLSLKKEKRQYILGYSITHNSMSQFFVDTSHNNRRDTDVKDEGLL